MAQLKDTTINGDLIINKDDKTIDVKSLLKELESRPQVYYGVTEPDVGLGKDGDLYIICEQIEQSEETTEETSE